MALRAGRHGRGRMTEAGTPPASVIYIGNSFFYYNNGISNLVAQMLTAGAPKQALRSTLVGIGGSGLDWHDVESYFRPNAIGRYFSRSAAQIIVQLLSI